MKSAEDVIRFWFVDHGSDDWFSSSAAFDAELTAAFADTHAAVALGEAWSWRESPEGRLAEILVLDQFSRQLFRGSARAFASDSMALALAQEAVAGGHDKALDPQKRMFLYMPYMHSESLVVHEEALRLFTDLDNENILKFEIAHADCLRRFGRYPRRNVALGRESTTEEKAYIADGDGMF